MIANLSHLHNLDSISKPRLMHEQGLSAYNREWYRSGCFRGPVLSFDCLIIRRDSVIGYVQNSFGRFTSETKELFTSVKSGDQIHFLNIVAQGMDAQQHLDPVKLTVK